MSGNTFEGCGIYANTSSGNIHVTNNAISGGSADETGGGIYSSTSSGDIDLTNNRISNNRATDYNYAYGGGVYLSASGNITLNNNTISENEVYHDSTLGFSRGGGVYVHSLGIVTINGNTIRKNIASSHGGGLHIDSIYDIILVNNIIAGNTAGKNAGGIYAHSTLGRIILTNNTITDNKTLPKDDFYTPKGGGLYLNCQEENASAYLYNNIIWGNESDLGEDVYIDAHIFSGIYVHNNNYHDVESRPFTEDVDNIDDDSLFANSEQGDYHLQSNSPCIDKGTADAPELPSTDYENDLRIIGSSPDMGADEYYDPSIYSTTTTTTILPQFCTTEQIYGEYSEETEMLRYLRDKILYHTPEGQELIRLYYEWSPVIVKAMEEDEGFREEVKEMIDEILGVIQD